MPANRSLRPQPTADMNPADCAPLGSGLFTVGGYFLMMFGISRMGASTAAFVSMLEPIVSLVFGTIWFGDPVTLGIAVGGLLVLASILLIAIDGSNKAKAAGSR